MPGAQIVGTRQYNTNQNYQLMDKKNLTKKYTNGEVTVVWKPGMCIHSAICANGLPGVFRPQEKPWVQMEHATTQEIVSQVSKCPSGALSYFMNDEENKEAEVLDTRAEVMENGPLIIYGTLHVTHKDGSKEKKEKTTAFCRCGHSNNKPYCDGAHIKAGFEG